MNEFEAIYALVRRIPSGRVAGYGQIGAALGVTARSVGWAMGQAPEDVPWQRVVGADGTLRTARRAPEIAALQRQLLTAEGVTFTPDGRVAPESFADDL